MNLLSVLGLNAVERGSSKNVANVHFGPNVDFGGNVDFVENPWISTKTMIFMDFHGFPWISMDFGENPWEFFNFPAKTYENLRFSSIRTQKTTFRRAQNT